MSATAAPTSAVVPTARAVSGLFRDHVLKGGPRNDRKDGVVEAEEAEIAAWIADDAGADTADHDRDRERQEEQGKDQLAGAADGGDRGEQRSDGDDTDVREGDGRDRAPPDPGEEDSVGRQRHELSGD